MPRCLRFKLLQRSLFLGAVTGQTENEDRLQEEVFRSPSRFGRSTIAGAQFRAFDRLGESMPYLPSCLRLMAAQSD
jgi:hypothetical protein